MRKILIILALALPLLAHARKEPGTTTIYPRIGLNWSKFTGDAVYIDVHNNRADAKFKLGFTGGVEVQHQFNNVIAASIGALYSRQGTKFDKISGTEGFEINTDNILVPILFVATSRIGLDFKMGLQPDFMVHSDFNDMMHKVNLSFPIGVAYEWHKVAIDVRYNIGLTKVYKYTDSYDKSHGGTLMITLGYAFDL